ncbi:transporter substrate-binding domain-containing protein [Actinosynnema sp. NPDC047251]|uniref:ABC-type transporter, substrate-binding lipoprotein n=1 Tax=Saccharothrix espanaensis (strain ATCC 51144 / DSM 44229 / JCM 9112 / NBRC 15066 / NRRL 15764) TaxID=1179773 RepID=K0K397_SACES|nr:transporter substrate-binding domain-containing protein [Saccharothrix espanaensis]CCH34705.1 ABC-type transporter, substrate-binding lipoprotein [Saccharothrix espanaensis DSM 44229]
MRTRHLLMLLSLLALVVGGCSTAGATNPTGAGVQPTADVLSGLAEDEAIAALLPADVRAAGVVKFGSSVGGQPPSSYYAEDNKTVLGQDVDLAEAVGRLLGVRIDREVAAFEVILPALGSGKYQVGTGNFGVTEARKKTIDFVTYINDGQGFAVRADDTRLTKVENLLQLCGLKVGTGAGTTFEATLEKEKHICPDAGKPAYEVLGFAENAAVYLGLQQRHIDVVMSTINGLRHAAANQPNLKFLNEFKRLDVGFAFQKGSPLAPAFRAAVDKLIQDGTYLRILEKWGTKDSAIPESLISPPEHA